MESPGFYSPLVKIYYDEARRSLENKCHIACIAMCWATLDYAIEHELSGGSRLNPKTFTPNSPIAYNPESLTDKLKKLSELFPQLSADWRNKILLVFKCFRNTFLHAKLQNFTEKTLPELPEGIKVFEIESAGHVLDLGVEVQPAGEESELPINERLRKEGYLIAWTQSVAAHSFVITTDLLNALNSAIGERKFPEDENRDINPEK